VCDHSSRNSEELADSTPTITPESRVQRSGSPDATPTEPPSSSLSLEELIAEIEAARRGAPE
jgi:hypothetical protein